MLARLYLTFFGCALCYREPYKGVPPAAPSSVIISDEYFYIPVGHSDAVPCQAALSTKAAQLQWSLMYWTFTSEKLETFGVKRTQQIGVGQHRLGRFTLNSSNGDLWIQNAQREIDGAVAECNVAGDAGWHQVSRIRFIVQDCGKDEDELRFRNTRNPCAFGACVVRTLANGTGVQRLDCDCLPHFTGKFCDVDTGDRWNSLLITLSHNFAWITLIAVYVIVKLLGLPRRKRAPLENLRRKAVSVKTTASSSRNRSARHK